MNNKFLNITYASNENVTKEENSNVLFLDKKKYEKILHHF